MVFHSTLQTTERRSLTPELFQAVLPPPLPQATQTSQSSQVENVNLEVKIETTPKTKRAYKRKMLSNHEKIPKKKKMLSNQMLSNCEERMLSDHEKIPKKKISNTNLKKKRSKNIDFKINHDKETQTPPNKTNEKIMIEETFKYIDMLLYSNKIYINVCAELKQIQIDYYIMVV